MRVEAEPERLFSYLQIHSYPIPWSLEGIQERCISIRIERGRDVLGYVWASWADAGVLNFHACTASRLWLRPELLDRLYIIAELFGAHTIETTPHGDTAPAIFRLLTRQGFERVGDSLTRRIDPTDGLYEPQDPEAGASPAPAAPAASSGPGPGDDTGRL